MESEPRLQRRTWQSAAMRMFVLLVGFVCMVGFAVALAKVTLQPSAASVDLTHTNLHPGDSIRMYLDQPAFRDTVKQIGGNLLLGVPFGVLLPVLIPSARGPLRVVLVTAVVMLMVESAQGVLVEGRAFDVDDVILNTTGALIGYLLLGRRLGRALHPRRNHWWQRSHGPAERTADPEPRRKPALRKPALRKPALWKQAGKKPAAAKKKPAAKAKPAARKKSAPAPWWRSLRPGRQ